MTEAARKTGRPALRDKLRRIGPQRLREWLDRCREG